RPGCRTDIDEQAHASDHASAANDRADRPKLKRAPTVRVHRPAAPIVTQHPASRPPTHRRSLPKHAVAPSVYWLADSFATSTVNSDLWGAPQTTGSGVQAVQRNGRIEFSIAPDVQYHIDPNWAGGGGVGANYGTNCYLTGDFDARIDF